MAKTKGTKRCKLKVKQRKCLSGKKSMASKRNEKIVKVNIHVEMNLASS
jgi:hypothetical protein